MTVKPCIITHNILHLRGIPKLAPKEKKRLDHSFLGLEITKTLIDFYHSLKPQIICLQEALSLKDARKTANLVKVKIYYKSGKINPKYGEAILVDSSHKSRKLFFSSLSEETFERGFLMSYISNKRKN